MALLHKKKFHHQNKVLKRVKASEKAKIESYLSETYNQ